MNQMVNNKNKYKNKTNTGPRSAAWFFKTLRLNNFPIICINVAIDQLIECLVGEQENHDSIPRKSEKFFTYINLFLRGNEPNGEQG